MSKIRFIMVGLGNYGRSWAYIAAKCTKGTLVGLVDQNQEMLDRVDLPIAKYQDLDSAVKELKPDAAILAVPPHLHIPVTRKLMDYGVAVLCEKPICDDLAEADEFLRMCEFEKRTCGIAENYRYRPVMRGAKQLLQGGAVGKILRMNCRFTHYHPDYSMYYHAGLRHPLLTDVTIHHLDLARYLSDSEPINVICVEHDAQHCWYGNRPATAEIASEMTGGIGFTYTGTLAAPASATDWFGDWEIMGDSGVMYISGTTVTLYVQENERKIWDFPDDGDTRQALLDCFLSSLESREVFESNIQDNYKSFFWTLKAIQSAETLKKIDL